MLTVYRDALRHTTLSGTTRHAVDSARSIAQGVLCVIARDKRSACDGGIVGSIPTCGSDGAQPLLA